MGQQILTMNGLVVLALLAVALPALEARVSPHIIGGRDARVGEFPWQGSLQRLGRRMSVETFPGHTCGCVLISDTWVVTAAHCVGAGPFGLYVVMGLHVRGDTSIGSPVGYYIEDIVTNPNWNRRTLQGDIALIKLIDSVEMNQYVRTIGMHSAGTNLDGASCTISGWGVTTTGGGSLAITLQKAAVTALSVDECQSYWSNTGEGHICVWQPGQKGACNGDSGGPCVCNGKLAGVTSFGQRGCYPNTPSAYTRISYYRNWIRSVSGV